jgi:hypothetical protein
MASSWHHHDVQEAWSILFERQRQIATTAQEIIIRKVTTICSNNKKTGIIIKKVSAIFCNNKKETQGSSRRLLLEFLSQGSDE